MWFTVIVGWARLNQTRLKILSSQSKGKKDKTMTKKEMAMMNELLATVKALNERIDKLVAQHWFLMLMLRLLNSFYHICRSKEECLV